MSDDILDFRSDNLADVPAFFTGAGTTNLVPSVFPVAINGRPYMIDRASNNFKAGFEPRIRDSVDQGTEPGEGSINPQGLWRRGQSSWHLGAGQLDADDADAQPFRFYKSRGVNPWMKGRLSLLNDTKLSLSSASTNLHMCTVKSSGGTEYLYVADGSTLKYTTDPFAASPTWTSVTTGSPGTAITGLETNGTNVYIAYTSNDIYYTTPGSSSVSFFYPTSGATGKTYGAFGYAKGWGLAAVDNKLYVIGVGSGGHNVHYTNPDTTWRWVGAAAGYNAVYAAGYSGTHSIVYKMTLKADATGLDQPVAALDLPIGEIVSSIYGYLGFILIGTNKGVRFCSTDANENLVAGPLIKTDSTVRGFAAEDRFVWFTWTNYESNVGGLGRLDLSRFTSPNAPAYATDLMYSSGNNVVDVVRFTDPTTLIPKAVFAVSGVGVVAEDAANLVASGNLETGYYKYGIPDRKFVVKLDARSLPLSGSVSLYTSLDGGAYGIAGTNSTQASTEFTADGPESYCISVGYKILLTRASATSGPTLVRFAGRAYAAPARSRFFQVPVLLHNRIDVWGQPYYMDPREERDILESLITSPGVITYQEGTRTFSVIPESLDWQAMDTTDRDWTWEGTAIITMRSVQE